MAMLPLCGGGKGWGWEGRVMTHKQLRQEYDAFPGMHATHLPKFVLISEGHQIVRLVVNILDPALPMIFSEIWEQLT